MVESWIPYGTTEVSVRIPIENLIDIVDVNEIPAFKKPSEKILRAINNPFGSKKLEKIVKPGDKAAIVLEDELFPANLILPLLIDKLSNLGVKVSDITIILGSNIQDLSNFELKKELNIVSSRVNAKRFTQVGYTSRGTKICINDAFVKADLRILTGRIGYHPYAGYIGGRSGVLPAISGAETIQSVYRFILDPKAKAGNLDGNPIHQEMEEAALLSKVNFIINVVLNTESGIIAAFAGDVKQAFLEGVRLLEEKFRVTVESLADIVILSPGGHPWDNTLYRACDGLTSALNIVKKGGRIIWVAECSEGYGSNIFCDWVANFKTADKIAKEIKKKFVLGGDAAYLLLRAQKRAKIILVSTLPDYSATGVFRLMTARTVNAALNIAFRTIGKKSKILVLPHGNTVFPLIKKRH